MADLDYCEVVGRLAITVGDTVEDLDANPDVLWCDEGTVRFTPLVTEMHVVGDTTTGPFTAGNAPIEATIDTEGRITYNGQPSVMLLDLGSDKVNPKIPRTAAAYKVTFENVRCRGQEVRFTGFTFHPLPDQVNDITLLAPLPVVGGEPIVQGPQGVGVEAIAVQAGDLVFTLDDGTVLNAGAVPTGAGVSNHDGLTGLDADDHPQYALADGSRGDFRPATWTPSWGEVGSKPATFPPSSHGHTIDQISGRSGLDQVAAGSAVYVDWDGTDWRYNDTVITSRPTSSPAVRFVLVDTLGTSTWPGWALAGVDLGLKAAT